MIIFMICDVPPHMVCTRVSAYARDRVFSHEAVTAEQLQVPVQMRTTQRAGLALGALGILLVTA